MSTPGDLLEALGREARARLGNSRDLADGVRLYRGRNIEELIPQIERDLGADALIVRRREGLTGGVLGFFQHAYVEIEAMPGTPRLDLYDEREAAAPPPYSELPEQPLYSPSPAPYASSPLPAPPLPAPYVAPPYTPPPEAPRPPAPSYSFPPPEPARPQPSASRPADAFGAGSYVSPQLAALARSEPPPPARPPQPPPTETFDFQELLIPSPQPRREPAAPERRLAATPERRTVAPGSHSRARLRVEKSLLRYGISEEFARELIDVAEAHTLPLAPRSGLAQAVLVTLARRIPVASPLPLEGAAIVMVGPGGAGKTSSCATMLSAYRSAGTLPAGFATLMHSANGEQLQLLLAPQIVKPSSAGSTRAMAALRKARREGLLIVDTPPLSPADKVPVRDLARLLGELAPERVVVALPATLGATAAQQLLSALAPLHANSVAITHADETDQIGVAVEAACRHELAPEYTLERGRATGWLLRRVDPADLASRMLP